MKLAERAGEPDGGDVLEALPRQTASRLPGRNGRASRSWRATGTVGSTLRASRHIAIAASDAMSGRGSVPK